MSESYRTLVRLGRWRLEEARRAHAELERHLAQLQGEHDLLLGRLAEERTPHDGDLAGRLDHQPYFRWALARGDDLAAGIEAAAARVAASREAMGEAYGELKTLELAAERARLRTQAERARRAQAELDEMSLNRHRREDRE